MKEIDKIERMIRWKMFNNEVAGHQRDIERITRKYHPPKTDAYRAYMQTQEKLADFLFGGLEKAIVKMKG